ncbi:MAG: xylose repressor [Balneolaceae bacterium]
MKSKKSLLKSESDVSRINRTKVLQLIREEKEITRLDIISKTGLSAPTISRITETLRSKKLIVQEELGQSSGGRPPQILRLNSKNNFVIGIDIGGDFIRAIYSNLDGEFIYEIHIPTEIELGFKGIMKKVGGLIQKLEERGEGDDRRVFGVGIAVAGVVDRKTEKVLYSPVLNWENVDVKEVLKNYTDLNISIGNVANLIAIGELFYGIGSTFDSFIAINLEYGIGTGIVINRELFLGSSGFSGELGHIVIQEDEQRLGRDGIEGTLEAHASSYEMVNIIKERIAKGEHSILEDLKGSISIYDVVDAAKEGDKLSIEVLDLATDLIAKSVDTLIKLFDPEAVTISGGISIKESFFDDILKKLEKTSLPNHPTIVPVIPSTFKEQGALMGAFSLVLNKIMRLDYE